MGNIVSPPLPDLLKKGLKAAVCGTGAGNKSAKEGEYYMHGGNRFWPTLIVYGVILPDFIKRLQRSRRLQEYGVGFTDLNKKQLGSDNVLQVEDFDTDSLRMKIIKYQPQRLILNSRHAGKIFFGHRVEYGHQENENIGDTEVYILPSTSSRNLMEYWDKNIGHWIEFCEFLKNN